MSNIVNFDTKLTGMALIDPITEPIEDELKSYYRYLRNCLNTKIRVLNYLLYIIIRKKRKQLRSVLVLLSAKLNGKTDTTEIFATAALIEILHTATLIHSDITEDYTGSGFSHSVKTLWKSKVAILIGDYLLAKGLLLAIKTKQHEILDTVSEAIKEMTEGQLLKQYLSRKLFFTRQQYFEIIKKTTVGSTICCISCGSKPPFLNTEKNLDFAIAFGIALQLKDDLICLQNINTKQRLTDKSIALIRFTLPFIYALEVADINESKKILQQIHDDTKNIIRYEVIIQFINKNDGFIYTRNQFDYYSQLALTALKECPYKEITDSFGSILSKDFPKEFKQ